jgi:hypothetical protein
MTYRKKIEELIQTIDGIYAQAQGLRDYASLEEKKYWNELLGTFYDAAGPLRNLNDSLPDHRATMEID